MVSEKLLRMSIQKTPPQKSCEMSVGTQNFTVEFTAANRQFDWLEILMVFDKSNKNSTVCDNYNVEKAANIVQSFTLENISQSCSVANKLKFDVNNSTHKYMLHMPCNGRSIALITDYECNPLFQVLPDNNTYFSESHKFVFRVE